MNWPFWCVLGWVGFGVSIVCLIAVAGWAIGIQRRLWRAWEREEQWAQEYRRLQGWKSESKPEDSIYGRN